MAPFRQTPLARYLPALAITAIVLAAAALRMLPLGESLWIDELHTAWCALAPIEEVAARGAAGNQAPLFFWLEWLVVRTLGPAEISLRLPSLIAGALLPLAVYLLALRWTTPAVGLIAAAVTAFDPLAIFYASEARPYALVQLLAVIHIGLTWQLFAAPARRIRAAWIVLAAVLFHLHYTAALIFAAELVALLAAKWSRLEQVAYGWRLATSDAFLLVLALAPALGTLPVIFARRSNWAEFVPQSDFWQAMVWWPALAGGGYLLAAALTGRRASLALLLTLCWAFVPITLAWLTTATDLARLFYPRYLVVVPPAAALLAAWCLELWPRHWSRWLYALLLVTAAAWSGGVPQRLISTGLPIAPRNEDWRSAIGWLNDQHPVRPYPVVLASGLIEAKEAAGAPSENLRDYLLLPVTALYPLDVHPDEIAPVPPTSGIRLEQTVEMLILHRGGAWVIVRGNQDSARSLAQAVAARLNQPPGSGTAWRITSAWSGGQVQVLAVEAAQP